MSLPARKFDGVDTIPLDLGELQHVPKQRTLPPLGQGNKRRCPTCARGGIATVFTDSGELWSIHSMETLMGRRQCTRSGTVVDR